VWNNSKAPPVTPTATQGYNSAYPTTGKTTLCSTDLKRERWAWMLNQEIKPPRFYAGLDMAKDDLWHGLTIEDAEARPADPNQPGGGLCQSVPGGFIGGCPSGIGSCNQNYWGNNAEVIFEWNIATHFVDQMELQLGYLGTVTAMSRDGMHTYVLKIGDVPKKDGQPFLIDWNGNPAPQATELFNAFMNTFATGAGVAWDTDSADCQADNYCLLENSQGNTYMGFRPLVIYFVGTSGVPQPALSTPILIYNFFNKAEPYSNLPQRLTLDKDGPIATGKPTGARDSTVTCTQKVGLAFGDLRQNCIQVHGPAGNPDMIDTVNLNKVLYGLSHDFEHWTAGVMGVNQNYTSESVSMNPDAVVLDDDKPQDADIAQDWTFDLRAKGHVLNDYNAQGRRDLRGSSMVYIEWARLMLQDINQQLKASGKIPANQPPKTLGDPSCTGFDRAGNPNFAPGCSGIEGMIIPGGHLGDFTKDASCVNNRTCLDPGSNWDALGLYGPSILKPGDIRGYFCVDPGNFTDCTSTGQSPWYTALNWVNRLMGNGNINSLPNELRDRRYYFKWFGVAFLKYLKAYSDYAVAANRDNFPCSTAVDNTCTNGGLGPSDVAAQYIDLESLFFDNNEQGGGNGFDKFEYIDRENIGRGQEGTAGQPFNWAPWDFEYGADIIGGNQRYDNWFRRMDREEIAMYSAMLENKTHTPGQENNVNITNLFGTGVIPSEWPSYQCAIGAGGDPAMSGCPPPPLDSSAMRSCRPDQMCDGTQPCQGSCRAGELCARAMTHETGIETVCGTACDFTNYPTTGCAKANQTCVASLIDGGATEACVDMMMDLNGATGPNPHPVLFYYPSVWSRTPFAMGHSPITLHAADKHPNIGAAKVTIPNFSDGPYAASPQLAQGVPAGCPTNWTLDGTGAWCNAPLNTGTTGTTAPSFTPLTPWLENQPGVGFSFPIDGQHDQYVSSGQLDFTGILETYLIDYIPWIDSGVPSCATGVQCGMGYTCDPIGKACVANDDTIRVLAIESQDFLGEVFLCMDPMTHDVLHVRQYDSAIAIIDWLNAHGGGWDPNIGDVQPAAKDACGIIIRYSPYNNYIDFITSRSNGVKLSINQGAGLGRVIDATLYDPSITQTP
jgi:hypothetical protein